MAMLVPAIAACFLYTPYWEVSFVAHFDFSPYRSAATTFKILFGDSWQFVWPVIVVAALQAVGAAVIMSAIDRHFRTGNLSLKSIGRLINISVFPIALGIALMSAVSILLRLALFGLVSLVQVVLGAMSASSGAVLAVISAMAVGVFFLHVLVLLPMLMWAPVMFIYGYKFRDAAALSFKMISGKKLLWSLLLPMLICAGLQLLIGFLQVHIAIACAVSFVIFLFTNVYTTVYTMIVFYDISGLDRRDIAPYKRPSVMLASQADAQLAQSEKAEERHEKHVGAKKPKKPSGNKPSQKPRKEDDRVL
ncbi:MAG: hypothetical protein J1F69_03080 [Clostridiales bacterium]|nr:hypothetical protein [Clostridiales bacterium]